MYVDNNGTNPRSSPVGSFPFSPRRCLVECTRGPTVAFTATQRYYKGRTCITGSSLQVSLTPSYRLMVLLYYRVYDVWLEVRTGTGFC